MKQNATFGDNVTSKKKLRMWAWLGIAFFTIALVSIGFWLMGDSSEVTLPIVISCISLFISGVLFNRGLRLGFYENSYLDDSVFYFQVKTRNLKAKMGKDESKILDLITEMKGVDYNNPFDKAGLLLLISFVENTNISNTSLGVPDFIKAKNSLLDKLNAILDEHIETK